VPVAHACNPSYSGGRDQEELWQVVHETFSKKPNTKRTGGVAQGIGPEFKFQYKKKMWSP
jgi:hypothetical protein